MRNFGNDSFIAQQHYLPHHQLSPLSLQQINVPVPPTTQSPSNVKMEPYHLAKNVGVGTGLKPKSHFPPVNVVALSSLHHPHNQNHHSNISGHQHNIYNNNCTNSSTSINNNPLGTPINLNHGQTTSTTQTTLPSSTSETINSHLPTAALAAACPITATANKGPSPAHHQSPINGLPYHSSHSPTLPVAHTALPSEVQSGTNPSSRNSPSSLPPSSHLNTNSPYHHTQYHASNFKIHNLTVNNTSTGNATDPASKTSSGPPSPMIHSDYHGSLSHANSEASRTHPPTTYCDESSRSTTRSGAGPTARIVSQNVNGTLAITGIPSNESELQLFRVLQRANLLSYFDIMIELGGDDVQQLCEAGKEEFLEIMALIGMAAKPLHVRRLQKALQEWMTQPSLFQSPVLPAGYQHHFGVSHVDRTISHTQFTTTIATASTGGGSNVNTGGVGQHPTQTSHPVPVIPIPHLIAHNPISPYPAQNAPLCGLEPSKNSSAATSNDTSYKADDRPPRNDSSNNKNVKSFDRGSNSSSPLLPSNATAAGETIVGLDKAYLQRGSPSIPVVISTAQTYNSGQHELSSCSSSLTEHYQNCPSPSGSTTSSSSGSSSSSNSTISIKSHHQFHHPPSPLESSPDSPVNSESGRSISNKHEESSTSTELENASSLSCPDQSNSVQLLDNSTGTATLRVASRSSSCCGSLGGGSEPSSPAPPHQSFSKGILISSSSQQTSDSPRPFTESVTNRNNNSVAVTYTTSSQDFSLQEHEIQKLTETAMNIVRSLPPHVREPKVSKKIETSSYEYIRRMAEDDPRKMDEIRRLSAIFGKTGESGKRNKGNSSCASLSVNKPVSILELAMNEAAAQLCKLVPALLTKRDEMFGLARQVIRDSGLPYAVICANSNLPSSFFGNHANNNNQEGVSFNKGKIDGIRNSPAHEERISNEFAAACKKIKLDMHSVDSKETNGQHMTSRKSADPLMRIVEVHNPLRKSPSRDKTLKKTTLGTAECRRSKTVVT